MWNRFNRLRALHRDERGSISILTVFAVLMLVMLWGMVINVGRQVDGKIRMQNAADSATYGGAVIMARQLNVLAFSNRLLTDTFALTAIMREGRDLRIPAGNYVPDILAAWREAAPLFQGATQGPSLIRFIDFGDIVAEETAKEQAAVDSYCTWLAAMSDLILPTLEFILSDESIPKFQRDVVRLYPGIAQMASEEIARRYGDDGSARGPMRSMLWHADFVLVGADRQMEAGYPIVDPLTDSTYLARARNSRNGYANRYLNDWNNDMMAGFDYVAEMCRFNDLWRAFTRGQLEKLKRDYPNTNLPMMMRNPPGAPQVSEPGPVQNAYLDQYFSYVGVVYWRHVPEIAPRFFNLASEGEAQAFAQARVFVPRKRLMWKERHESNHRIRMGGIAGDWRDLELDPPTGGGGDPDHDWRIGREPCCDGSRRRIDWTLWNQNWIAQLAPANAEMLPAMLAQPSIYGDVAPAGHGLAVDQLRRVNTH